MVALEDLIVFVGLQIRFSWLNPLCDVDMLQSPAKFTVASHWRCRGGTARRLYGDA